jgi:hypothetical protein
MHQTRIMTCVSFVLNSILGQYIFSSFSPVSTCKCLDSTSVCSRPLSSKSFYKLIFHQSFCWSASYSLATDSDVSNLRPPASEGDYMIYFSEFQEGFGIETSPRSVKGTYTRRDSLRKDMSLNEVLP